MWFCSQSQIITNRCGAMSNKSNTVIISDTLEVFQTSVAPRKRFGNNVAKRPFCQILFDYGCNILAAARTLLTAAAEEEEEEETTYHNPAASKHFRAETKTAESSFDLLKK